MTTSDHTMTGTLSGIYTASERRGAMTSWETRQVLKDKGLIYDRYTQGKGSYQSNAAGQRCVSLMDMKFVHAFRWKPEHTRRNLFINAHKDVSDPLDLACALDMAMNSDGSLRRHLGNPATNCHIMIGLARFEITGYCTPCLVPDAERQKDTGDFIGSFKDDFGGVGGLLLRPLNDETLRLDQPFYQLKRGY